MKRITLAGLGIITCTLLCCAKGNITGIVANSDTGIPMDFVTVQIFNESSGKPLQISVMTDDEGAFTLPDIPDGSYIVKISNVGSVNQERPVKVSGGDVNIGTIRLADDAKVLKEVVVEGIRSQMRFELDKKVFQVDSNIASAGSSASELLESIPSVEVDQDGAVSLRGNSSVTVWINGKDSGMTADNQGQILEQIPSENIDRIEVITNPSAKYNPEGTAGIINIILKKNTRGGYYGSAELGADTRGGGNVSANINWNTERWETYASVGFRMRHNSGGNVMNRDFLDGTYVHSNGKSRNHGNNIFFRLGATYNITDADALSLSGFGMFGHRYGHTETWYESNMPGQWLMDEQQSRNRSCNNGGHAELSYSHKWNDNHTLDATLSYNYWGGPNWNSYAENQTWPADSTATAYREQEMPVNVSSWEAKIDYTNTFNQYLKMEAGFNGNYSREDTPNTTWRGPTYDNAPIATELYNRFIYDNNISALYLTLGGRKGIFSYSAGVRAEAWQIRSRSLNWGETEKETAPYKKNKFSLFPTVYLSLALPQSNELQLNYTRRIRRPFGGQLNSFMNISDPTSISYGNPQLEPQYSNALELNYLKTWTWHILSVSAYMRQSSNIMNRVSFRDGDVMYSTWANVSDQINSGMEIVGKNSLFHSRLDLTTTINLYHSYIGAWDYSMQAPSGQMVNMSGNKQSSFAWDARMMANVRLPWGISFQATGQYTSEHKTATGSHQGGWKVDAGLRKVLGNWSFSINVRDIFDSRKWKNTIYGADYTEYSERWRGGRTFRFTVKYSFGNMKGKRNKINEGEVPESNSGYGEGEF